MDNKKYVELLNYFGNARVVPYVRNHLASEFNSMGYRKYRYQEYERFNTIDACSYIIANMNKKKR